MKADAIAKPAGQTPCRIDMRAGDARTYRLDCGPLLRDHELLVKVDEVLVDGVGADGARTRQGTMIEVLLSAEAVTGLTRYRDFSLAFRTKTTQGVLYVAAVVRVHA